MRKGKNIVNKLLFKYRLARVVKETCFRFACRDLQNHDYNQRQVHTLAMAFKFLVDTSNQMVNSV